MEWMFIVMVVLIASLVKGITGFGFALVSLPILVAWFPVKELIPVLTICNLLASIVIVLQKKSIPLINSSSRLLIYSGSVATILGVILLSSISETVVTLVIAALMALLSMVSILGKLGKFSNKPVNFVYAGIISGLLAGSVSISGPPLAIFMKGIRMEKAEFREVFSWFSIITATIALTGYYLSGLLSFAEVKLSLCFFPILYIGSYLGKRINARISLKVFDKMNALICFVSCVILVINLLK
ncbi:MAG: sulfite exporter TauE/SafE family protein [Breznakibacter sp.]